MIKFENLMLIGMTRINGCKQLHRAQSDVRGMF